MSEDFLDELGELALGSRLERLSERLMGQAAGEALGKIRVQIATLKLEALRHGLDGSFVLTWAGVLKGFSSPSIFWISD